MHMADALLSPAVGGTMWAVTGAVTVYCSHKIKDRLEDRKIPLMGVMGAFVFAAQMINFAIPGTGSSGHLGGGLLLAVILGPQAAFLTLASVLTVQALFFADGGLLALGSNIFNLGFAPCFVAYPLIYKPLAGKELTSGRLLAGTAIAAIAGLQIGSLGVVIETYLSGIISLSFPSFLLLMQTIHLPIGLVEGLATAGVISFLLKARPEMINGVKRDTSKIGLSSGRVITVLALAAIITGGILSWYASENPDGLEWSLGKSSIKQDLPVTPEKDHSTIESIQDKVALLPDYGFRSRENAKRQKNRPDPAATLSGIIGSVIVLVLILLTCLFLRKKEGGHGR